MRYRVVVHAPAPAEEEPALDRIRAALEGDGVEVRELRVEDHFEGGRVFHIETALEAPSSYHAARVTAPDLFKRLLVDADVGLEDAEIDIVAERDGGA